jgi:hypothetical protein
MVANSAHGPEEAEAWDLEFWQAVGPEARLAALVAIHEDVARAETARARADESGDER